MDLPGRHTRDEILSQPDVWAATLALVRSQAEGLGAFYRDGGYDAVLFTGCGSTYYLAIAAAALLEQLGGIPARGLPASEIWLAPPAAPAARRALLVAVSRSGETTETLRACERFLSEGRGDLLTLTCSPDSRLARRGARNLIAAAAQEQSIAQTRAFSALYLAAVALAALWTDRAGLLDELARLPAACRRLLDGFGERAGALGRDESLDRFYFLGSGPRYGLAYELSLKMKEMSLSHSEAFHFLEFRHGPQSMVTPGTLIVGLVSEANRAREVAVLDEMRARGAQVLAIGESEADVAFASGVSEAARGPLYLPAGQLLAFERAVARGYDPDRPHNLTAVVTLDGQQPAR